MRIQIIALLVCSFLSRGSTCRADYLEVRRETNIKQSADKDSATLMRVEPNQILMLAKLKQENGYYKVLLPNSNQAGFIYRTFGRGFRGNPPNFTQADFDRFRKRHLSVGTPQPYFERIREGYAVGYDARLKIPLWVQYDISPEDVTRTDANRHVKRKDDFRPDSSMPEIAWAQNSDYKEKTAPGKKAYARGHMAPAADMIRSERVMSESFFLSNMVPQVGDEFNGSIWEDLERDARKWIKNNGNVTIIVGPVFKSKKKNQKAHVTYQVIGDRRVAVPTHLFKIIVDNRSPLKPQALAFLMENRQYGDDESYSDFLVSIDEIEELTSLDLLQNLDNGIEAQLESKAATEVWWEED